MADTNISIFNDGQHYVTDEFTVAFEEGGTVEGQFNFTIDGVQDLWSVYEDIEDKNTAEAGSKVIPTNEQWAWVEYDEDDATDSDGITIDADDWDDATYGTYGITGYEAAGFRSVSAMYGYFVNVGDLYNIAENSGTFFPQFSEDDSLYGDRRTNLIYGGDGNDSIYGGDTTKTYWDIDTYNFYVDDFDNDLLLTTTEVTETITFSDSTTLDVVTVEGGNFSGSFESDGADFLFGNDGDDYIVSGGGDTVASGGEGDDYIIVTTGEKDENHLFGGTGSDIFIVNTDPDSGDEADDDDSVAEIIFGDDISDTADTVISALALGGIENPALDVLDFSIPIVEGLLNKFISDVEATSAETSSDLTSTIIYDFDPREDYLILYAGADDSISFDSAGDVIGDYVGTSFTDNEGNKVLSVTGELFSSIDAADNLSTQFVNDAVFMEKSGSGEYFVRQGSRTYTADELGDSSLFSDLGLTGYNSQLIMIGAYGPKNIYGTSDANTLHGTVAYADVLYGYSYDDVDGDSDSDTLYGYGGDDWLTGGGGDDNLWGGDGTDTAFYLTSETGISVDLSDLQYDAINDEYYAEADDGNEESSAKVQGRDRLYSIENISGSYYADIIVGDDNDNTIAGLAAKPEDLTGNDALANNDVLFGGGGTDTVSFVNAEGAVTLDLINQSDEDYKESDDPKTDYTANAVTDDGSGNQAFLSGFENITGSDYDDSLTGDDSDNVIEGRSGDDILEGRGGDDTLYGGTADDGADGNDTVSYSTASSAVTVDLASGTASDGEGGTDTLYDIDNVIGSDHDDTLKGDDHANILDGGSGTDTADYSDADGPISILINGGTVTVTDSNGVVDTLKNIEHFIGTNSSEDSVELTGDTSIDFFTFEDIETITNNSSVETDTNVTVTLSNDEFDGNFADDDLSLREALFKVADGGTIKFDDSLDGSTIALDSELGQLEIDRSVQIDASTLDLTVDALGNSRVFFISDESYTVDMKAVVIDGLTITGGSAFGAFLSDRGAGIFNKESLTLTNSTITGNAAETGAGIYNYFDANLTLTNSTISSNTAEYSAGGLRDAGDITTITNSTFSGNEVTSTSSSSGDGGAIRMSGTTLTLSNSTITGNTTGDDGGGIYRSSGTLTIVSSIISGNTAGDEGNEIKSSAFGPQAISGGNNLFGDNSQTESEALENVTLDDTDILATSDGDTPTALNDILDTTLGDDGTHALVEGSPAIDAGRNDDGLTTDQRGADRTVDGDGDTTATIDIGAYEYQGSTTSSGTVSNGPVQSSVVYWDANFNNEVDPDEPIANTDGSGSYNLTISLDQFDTNRNGQLDDDEGRLVATGGIDTIGGIPLYSDLWAGPKSSMITPLTTMVQWLVENGFDRNEAEGKIKQVVGIDDAIDLQSFDAVAALQNGTQTEAAEATYLAHIQVAFLLHSVTHFLSGASGQDLRAVDELAVGLVATGLLSLSELESTLAADTEAFKTTFDQVLTSQLGNSILTAIDAADQALLIQGIELSIQLIDQVLTTIDSSESFLDASASLKPILCTVIPELLYEVAAQTITVETARSQLEQIVALGAAGGQILIATTEEVVNLLGSGDDYLFFSSGDSNREFNGNGGNDTFFLGEGSQRANLGTGNDTVFAGGGDDLIRDNGGVNNQLFGGEGDDLIVASAGGGIINGGAGFDTIEINGAQGYVVQLELDASSGVDTFDTIRNVNEQTLRDGLVTFDVLGVDSPQVSFTQSGNGTQVNLNGDNLMFIDNIQPAQLEALNNSQRLFI